MCYVTHRTCNYSSSTQSVIIFKVWICTNRLTTKFLLFYSLKIVTKINIECSKNNSMMYSVPTPIKFLDIKFCSQCHHILTKEFLNVIYEMHSLRAFKSYPTWLYLTKEFFRSYIWNALIKALRAFKSYPSPTWLYLKHNHI